MPWHEAFCERVIEKCKKSFKELVDLKGLPEDGCYGFITTPNPQDYHALAMAISAAIFFLLLKLCK